ncbi:MAG: (d)CMP kinase [Bacteroidota bacterium]
MRDITIAIDGYAACGKSSTAKTVARELGYRYIDSGAMYRAVTLYFQLYNIPFEEMNDQLLASLENLKVDFQINPETNKSEVYLNDKPVEHLIRMPEVSAQVSLAAKHKPVRVAMVAAQRNMGAEKRIVMDGRDIGTVVFPDAELKVFMMADMDIRAKRRQLELQEKGVDQSLEDIKHNLAERDHIDTTRKESPLKQAEDALILDTSDMDFREQVAQVIAWAKERMRSAASK